jgi:hypothetical protein
MIRESGSGSIALDGPTALIRPSSQSKTPFSMTSFGVTTAQPMIARRFAISEFPSEN